MAPVSKSQVGQSAAAALRPAELLARYGIIFVLIVLVTAITVMTPIIRDGVQLFMTPQNLLQVALQASINAVIAVGMTYVITSGGIDLSVGSQVALGGVLGALAMRDLAVGPIGGFLVCVIVCGICGLVNGMLIARVQLSPFIATLGTMGIFRGVALVISEGQSIYGFDRTFGEIFAGRIGDLLPVPVVVAVAVALILWFVLTKTRFGKYTIAIGGSEEAARVAGIDVGRQKIGIYVVCGLLTGVAAALLLARLRSGDPTFGQFFELDAIAAAVMGGTSLTGGEGTIAGTIVGALIISLVQNAMNLWNVPSYWQQVIIGSVIVFAVVLDQWRKRQGQPRD